MPNTFIKTKTNSIGLLWNPSKEKSKVGISHSSYKSLFGIPFQYKGDPNELYGDTILDLKQYRYDLEARITNDEKSNEISIRIGKGEYKHEENFVGKAKDQDKSFVDTIMKLSSYEGRLDFFHKVSDNLEGIAGIQFLSKNMESSRIPNLYDNQRVKNLYDTINRSLFISENYSLGKVNIKSGYRYEFQSIKRPFINRI